jgi:hypothetical protein
MYAADHRAKDGSEPAAQTLSLPEGHDEAPNSGISLPRTLRPHGRDDLPQRLDAGAPLHAGYRLVEGDYEIVIRLFGHGASAVEWRRRRYTSGGRHVSLIVNISESRAPAR